MDTSLIEGLTEAIDKGVVCSNYTDPKHTWEVIKNFKGGNAVFTQPATPIKCGGAVSKMETSRLPQRWIAHVAPLAAPKPLDCARYAAV